MFSRLPLSRNDCISSATPAKSLTTNVFFGDRMTRTKAIFPNPTDIESYRAAQNDSKMVSSIGSGPFFRKDRFMSDSEQKGEAEPRTDSRNLPAQPIANTIGSMSKAEETFVASSRSPDPDQSKGKKMFESMPKCLSRATSWLRQTGRGSGKNLKILERSEEGAASEDAGVSHILTMIAKLSATSKDSLAKKVSLSPRALSLAVIERNDGRILVDQGFDPKKGRAFYRLLGGGIDFGELSEAAVIREIQEELGLAVRTEEHLGTIENVFSFAGKPGHEIAFVHRVSFVDNLVYERSSFQVADFSRTPTVAVWKSLQEMKAEELNLYPEGVVELVFGGRSRKERDCDE